MRIFVVLTILLVLLSPMYARAAAEPSTIEIGVRGGKDFSKGNADESYDAAEIYLLKKLPWGTTLGEENKLTSRFDIGATYLEGGDDEGTMLAAGADLVLGLWADSVELEIGFRPTWMFDHVYGDDDFGGGMQFTSHAGVAVNWRQVVLSYRAQHTSNAGI